jgi:hypothetical protein
MENTFKEGEWVYCDFDLKQISKVRDGCVTSVSDGYFSHGGSNLNYKIFHMDMSIKLISAEYRRLYKSLHDLKFSSLNYPDFNRYFIDHWVKTCINKDNDKFVQKRYTEIEKFTRDISDKIEDARNIEIDGVSLHRQQ